MQNEKIDKKKKKYIFMSIVNVVSGCNVSHDWVIKN